MSSNSEIKVYFQDFWPESDMAINHFFLPLLQHATKLRIRHVNDIRAAEVIVSSVFKDPPQRFFGRKKVVIGNRALKIFYTGENIRVPSSNFDLTWGFDIDEYDGSNSYLPVWLLDLDIFGNPINSNLGIPLHVDELVSKRAPINIPQKFACIIANNPHPLRFRAISALSAIGNVDVFGQLGNNPIKSKAELRNMYRYVICFENDYFPGYVTEKVFHAWAMGAVPVFWGYDILEYINKEAVVNLTPKMNIRNLCEQIKILEDNPSAWMWKYQQPILNMPPDAQKIIEGLSHKLGQRFSN